MYTKALSKRAEPRELVEGRSYVLGMSIPLMPAFEIGDLMLNQKAGLVPRMIPVPLRCVVKVVEIKLKREVPWYRVRLTGDDARTATAGTQKKVEGWLNSIALIKCGVFEIEEDE